jgi:hypothetical protein
MLNRREAMAAAIGAVGAAALPAVKDKSHRIIQHVHSSLHVSSKSRGFYLIGWDGEQWCRIIGPFSQESAPDSIHCETKGQGLLVAIKGQISFKGSPPELAGIVRV